MNFLSKDEYESNERKQTIHRSVNTLLMVAVIFLGIAFIEDKLAPIYDELSGAKEERIERQEIGQILNDEGLRRCVYDDTLKNATIGVGHLVTKKDNFGKCIDEEQIIHLLIKDYRHAKSSVERIYPWAEDEVKLILINMTFQLGAHGVSKFKGMLAALEKGDYTKATIELLDSIAHRQTPKRIERHAARILSLSDDVR